MMDTNPTNPIEIITRLLIALFMGFVLFFAGTSQSVSPPPAVAIETLSTMTVTSNQSLTLIDTVEARVLKSNPAQISLHITGQQPDGCELPVKIEQRREGSHVFVKIYREMPGDVMCTMMLVPYQGDVKLDGSFPSGEYIIDVNNTVIRVKT